MPLQRGQIQKVVTESQNKISGIKIKVPLFFRFELPGSLEARAEILKKFRWFFGRFEDTKRTSAVLESITFIS